ncbi:MAG: ABC-2 transporter permease [Christensenella sp.]|nr:ABC-2 transporter permease [Christensenella sp.]
MKNLLIKEFRLAMHPAAIIFIFLASMLLIPNYPYFVVMFYTCLGIFFICLTARENHDIDYTMLLPVRKSDLVSARILMVVLLQLIELAICVIFAVIRSRLLGNNEAGMNPNLAFFGYAFILFGIFNLVFFTQYYKNPDKVGVPFLIACIVIGILIFAMEATGFLIPALRTYLKDDPSAFPLQLLVFLIGAALYLLFTFLTVRVSRKRFLTLDL